MNKTELLHLLEETVPPLRGKLHIERVLYQKAANKAYMSFLSDELVTEHDYLLLERRLRELFPKLTVALRIASPSLGEKFLADLNRYKPVLTDFLRRQSPALAAWIADTGWSLEDGRILLTCPDQIAMGFFRSHHLDEKLSQAIYDIFRVRTPVALTVCGEREAWVEKMRADRGFSFAALWFLIFFPFRAVLFHHASDFTGGLNQFSKAVNEQGSHIRRYAPGQQYREARRHGRMKAAVVDP